MAIKIDILEDDNITSLLVGTSIPPVVTENPSEEIVIVDSQTDSVAIDVLKGLPGEQILYVGYTPPENPQEGWVWVNLNG